MVLMTVSQSFDTAAGQSQPASHAWFDRELLESRQVPDLTGWSISYSEKIYPALTPEEAASVRSQIATKPDHPRRADLEAFDSFTRTRQPYTISLRFFSGGNQKWRWCSTHPDEYWDSAMSPDGAWKLTSQAMDVYPENDRESEVAKQRLSMVIPQIFRFIYGGLGIAETSGLVFNRFETLPDNRWRAVGTLSASPNLPYAHVFEGRWDDAAARGFVEDTAVYQKGYPGPAIEREHYTGWERSADTGRWLAHRVERFDARNRLVRSFEIDAIEKNPAPIDQLVRIPSMDGQDPIRGQLHIAEVADHRSSEYTVRNSDGSVGHGVIIPEQKSISPWKWAGWGVLATLAIFAIFVARMKLAR